MVYTSVGGSVLDVVVAATRHSAATVQEGGIGQRCWAIVMGKPLLGTRAV